MMYNDVNKTRYVHYLLFYSMFLPLDGVWAIDSAKKKNNNTIASTFVTPATIALKLLIVWLYWDAGYGKYSDPLKGWTMNPLYNALPALDTYVRHTTVARYLYALAGSAGLRYMTPTVPYVEMFGAPVALVGSYLGSKKLVYTAVVLMCTMHIGIALTINNTVLLSLVACVAWCMFLPEGVGNTDLGISLAVSERRHLAATIKIDNTRPKSFMKKHGVSALIIGMFVCGNIWFETMSDQCNQSMEHIWSTLLHCRWNVFVGAEE